MVNFVSPASRTGDVQMQRLLLTTIADMRLPSKSQKIVDDSKKTPVIVICTVPLDGPAVGQIEKDEFEAYNK